jgi:bacillithiol system protein YtxJ
VVRVTPRDHTDRLRPLASVEQMTAVLAQSAEAPVFVFKHSETCGMSWQAHEEVGLAIADAAWDTDIYVVSVQRARAVSNEIARRLQVHHASPQLLLIVDGDVRWQASHMAITMNAMRKALARLTPLA